jgi:cellulose synthase/poly-beta-1,6-N-acetylglucosamine synthase-like glycosyltransferase
LVAYGIVAGYVALAVGMFFFIGYAVRYYLYVAVLFFLNIFLKNGIGNGNRNNRMVARPSLREGLTAEPLVSIHLPVYNEPNVVERLLASCTTLDYWNYEVILVDDSTDHTVDTLRDWAEHNPISYQVGQGPQGAQVMVTNSLASLQIPIKIVHRTKRTGFKGGALNEALKHMNPEAEYVMIFDADFIPPPDIIRRCLPYFTQEPASEIFRKITELDEAYANGKVDLDTYARDRERLATKLRGRSAIIDAAKLGMQSLFKLDQLYAKKEIDTYEHRVRRKAIEDEIAKIPMAADPYAEQSLALHRAFTISQLYAQNKITSADYKTRIQAVFAPFNGEPHPTDEYDRTLLEIVDMDMRYASGEMASDEYETKRKELVSKLETLGKNHEKLNEATNVNQAHATYGRSDNKLANGNVNGKKGKAAGEGKIRRGLRSILELSKRGGGYEYVAVQGYQLHSLNQSENWVTSGVRAEFSGSYMIERPAQEMFGSMKMISGSVYMIRAGVLKHYEWSESITEDWELTCRLYLDGKRIAYTPMVQANAESPATLGRLIRQRQRWAEGHSYNARKYFWKFMKSPNTTLTEKLEFLYYTPYYIQGLFFIIGTISWLIQLYTRSYLPFWNALFGWGLIMSNSFAIPLMNFSGLVSEGPARKDIRGVLSAIMLSYLLAFFQGYAALKGFLEKKEGGWVRTYKTGKIIGTRFEVHPRIRLPPIPAQPPRRRVVALGGIARALRRAPATTVIILLLAGLLATNLLLAMNVQSVQALPANMKWFPAANAGLQLAPTGGSTTVTLSRAPQFWSTAPTQYAISGNDAVSGFVFHLVCTGAAQGPPYNLTVNLYYSTTTTGGNLLQSGQANSRDLNCDGVNENLIPLTPQPWTGTPGTYHLNLEVRTSGTAGGLVVVVGGPHASYLSDGNSIPEYVLPFIALAPLIPIAMKRRGRKKK